MPGIEEYYSGRTLLVTGGTGLVGKVLLESILRKLPGVRKVYVLIRPRTRADGSLRTAARRLREEILGSSAFDHLRSLHGSGFDSFVRQRLEAVAGDLSREGLGMDPDAYETLRREVDVVINSGALAVFDAPLDLALRTNALGPRRVLEFARDSAKRAFVAHVSTCYVNALGGPVFETPLDPTQIPAEAGSREPFDVDDEVRAIQDRVDRIRSREADRALRSLRHRLKAAWSDRGNARRGEDGPAQGRAKDLVRELRDEWIRRRLVEEGMEWARRRGWNDTYTFTKAMGEQLFMRHRGEVPGLILRPSIIESSLCTPAPGWMDGFRMLDPLIVSFARGQLFEFPGNPESVLDVVPADIVVNALLAAIPWTHARGEPLVLQVASGMENPLKLKDFRDYLVEYFERAPLGRGVGGENHLPEVTFPESRQFLRRLEYRHLLPLRLLERAGSLLRPTSWGRRRHAHLRSRRAALERLHRYAVIYGPYAESQARFLTFNTRRLWKALSAEERRSFPFDIRTLNWRRYVQEIHVPGIKFHLLGIGPPEAGAAPAGDESPPGWRPGDDAAPPQSGPAKAEKVLSLIDRLDPREVGRWITPVHAKMFRAACCRLIRTICDRHLDLECAGREHIPERGPFIVVSNHTSHVDTGVLLASLGRLATRVHPAAATDYWFRNPLLGRLLHSTLGAIPFDRHSPNVSQALSLPAEILRNGGSLIFYPEGGRSLTGELRPFKSAIGLLALASAAPLLPVYIEGAYKALPKGKPFIKRHPVRVRFGPPIPIEPYLGRLDRESVSDLARELAEHVQTAVASLRKRRTE